MQWLANVSVRRPVFATVLVLAIVVLGVVSFGSLGVDRFPDVDFPMVSVVTRLPGSAPEEVESEITDEIEEAVNTIGGIDELRSVSSEGVSQVMITFELDKDIDVAVQEVRDKVSNVLPNLPEDVEAPVVSKTDPSATPVLYVSVQANRPVREITEIADRRIRRGIETADGVGQVNLVGGRRRQVNVWLDPLAMRSAGVTDAEVRRAIAGQNLVMPGGRLETGPEQLTLRIRGRVGSPDAVGDIVVRQQDDHPIRVRDVARVEDGEEQAETVAVRDGTPAVLLSIRKQSGANTVAVVDAVRERLDEMQATLPAGYSLKVVRDNSESIRTSVDAVEEHLVIGALFAAAVVLLFLANLRSTIIAAIAIPVSIIGTFSLMALEGFTLDTITLLALALSVGIVIDDAIVVLENIVRTIEEKGMSPFEAAIHATKEIGLAVLATTLSLIAVFLPVAFMGGIVGRFLESFGLTMAFAIGVSMFVSFSLTPMLSSRWLAALRPIGGAEHGRHTRKNLLERIVDAGYKPVERAYGVILAWSMRHRWVIVAASGLTLASIVPLMGVVPKGFLPVSDEAQFEINIRAPEGTSLDATAVIAERVARKVHRVKGVESTLMTIGDSQDRSPNVAKIFVRLSLPEDREETQDELMARVRTDILAHEPKSLRIDASNTALFEGTGTTATVSYELNGPDLDKLEEYATKTVEALRRSPAAVDVDSTLVTGKPEVGLSIDREKAATLGVQVSDIAATLRTLVAGQTVSDYEEGGEHYDVVLRADARFRTDEASLALLTVPSQRGGTVPLLEVVDVERSTGPASINRLNRRRQITINSNVTPGYADGDVIKAIETTVAGLHMPADYSAAPVGRSKEMAKAGQAFALAFLLSFVFMYLVLAAQFESWLHPITILVALPLTLPFAMVSLLIFHQALDIYSCLGILVLFGVVKKNSILQIDHTNQLRAQGMERLAAILAANKDRLRPILMTTLAFVVGMLPLAFSHGVGSGFNRATAGVVVGGQTLSLLLTLLATPVFYSLFDDVQLFLQRRRAAKTVPTAAYAAEELDGARPSIA